MVKAIIVDDERRSGELLHSLVNDYCKDVQVIDMADTVESGVASVKKHRPDLLFLDIELHNGTGFDLLEKVSGTEVDVIFTTAFENYALKAIKFCAIDYLLKPIDATELQQAVAKVQDKRNSELHGLGLSTLLQNLKTGVNDHRIALPTSEGLTFVNVNDIIRCEADGSYTHFFFKDGAKMLVSKKIKEYDELLSSYRFCRVHHSHLINLNEIKKYVRGDGGYVVMNDGQMVDVSKRKREDFLAALNKA